MLDERGQVTLDFAVGCGLLVAVVFAAFQATAAMLSPAATSEYHAENYPLARRLADGLAASPGEPANWTADDVGWPGLCDAPMVVNLTKLAQLSALQARLGPDGLRGRLGLRDPSNRYMCWVRVEVEGVALLSVGDAYRGQPGMGQAWSPVAIWDPDTREVRLGRLTVQVWREWGGRDWGG